MTSSFRTGQGHNSQSESEDSEEEERLLEDSSDGEEHDEHEQAIKVGSGERRCADTKRPPQDLCGAQLSKRDLREELKLVKRVDDISPNIKLNPELIAKFHKTLLGGGQWVSKVRKTMRERYYLPHDQYMRMEAPSLRGSKLNMAIRGLDFGTLGKTLLNLHQNTRDVMKIALRSHEILLSNSRKARKWEPIETHDAKGGIYVHSDTPT